MYETSVNLEEKEPKIPYMGNGDQKMQAARKEEQVVEVPSIDFVFKGSTMDTRRLRSDDTHEVPKG